VYCALLSRVRWLNVALAVWYLGWFVGMARHGGMAWHFFVQGGAALSDLDDPTAGGLHLYAALPILQIGPVALIGGWLFSFLGPHGGLVVAQVFAAATGLLILATVRQIALDARPDLTARHIDRQTAAATVFFTPVWMYLAVGSAHLDDVLALLFAVLATHATRQHRAVLAGVLFGMAVDCKPWALPFGCLLLLLADRKARTLGALALAATVALAWSPFLLADPATTNAIHFTIPNTSRSGLRAIGIDTPRTPPWDRPAQAALGAALSLLALRRCRWAAVPMLVIAARLALDPGSNRYYTAGLAVGATLWDIAGTTSSWPWWSTTVFVGLYASRWVPLPPTLYGWTTIAFFVTCTTAAVGTGRVFPARWHSRTHPPPESADQHPQDLPTEDRTHR
jgi:hypothetical protein